MATARNLLLSRPQWVINNQLTMPLITIADGTNKKSIRGLVVVAVPFTIFLDTIFNPKRVNKRSAEQDQFQVYKTIEGILQATGMDGKACLLRTICEVQRSSLGLSSYAGEFASLLFSPKKGDGGLGGFLHDYVVAERAGHSMNQSCSESFPRCPISLFDSSDDDDQVSVVPVVPANKTEAVVPKQNKTEHSNHDVYVEDQHKSLWKQHTFSVDNGL